MNKIINALKSLFETYKNNIRTEKSSLLFKKSDRKTRRISSWAKSSDGYIGWFDENGENIYTNAPDGNETWYNTHGRLVYSKKPDGSERWYDGRGNLIRIKNSNGYEKM